MTERIININERTIQTFVKKNRPPIEIRDKLDLGYSFKNNVLEIFETRPIWNKTDEFQNFSFAKIKYVKSQKRWKLFGCEPLENGNLTNHSQIQIIWKFYFQ